MSCYGSRGLWEQMHFGHKSFLSIYVRGWNKGGIYFVWNAENIYGFSPPSIEKNCHQRSYFSNCIISATFPPEKIAESWIFTNVSETAQVMNGEGQREQLNLRIFRKPPNVRLKCVVLGIVSILLLPDECRVFQEGLVRPRGQNGQCFVCPNDWVGQGRAKALE